MKYATRILALALTMLPLLATAQLTSNEKIVAQVPFEFVLGSKVVPAGEWIVQSASMDSKVIQIRSSDSRVNILSMPLLVETKKAAADCTLVFHKSEACRHGEWLPVAGNQSGKRNARTEYSCYQ